MISLHEALQLWVELTGVEPGQTGQFTIGEWAIRDLHQSIQEALDLDSTEVTGKMILAYVAGNYFTDRSFTVKELLLDPVRVEAYLQKARTLASYLQSDVVKSHADDFADEIRRVLQRYGALSAGAEEILGATGNLGDRAVLAVLRRDALRSMKNLQIYQFLDGDGEPSSVRPLYGEHLYRWENINSMLRAMIAAPSGITVNMISDPANRLGVYFAFAIRNGARLFVFTDKEWAPHPLAESMWRRPDKILAARADRNWFPYDVAGLRFDDSGVAYIETSTGRSIAQYQTQGVPVRRLSELHPMQMIWISMMLELIVGKFWHSEHREAALSYTGEMLKVASPLLESAVAAQLPIDPSTLQGLELPPIELADVHSSVVREADVGKMGASDGANDWLEERYRDRVIPKTLNLVAGTRDDSLVVLHKPRCVPVLVSEKSGTVLKHSFADEGRVARTHSVSASEFGTKEQLAQDRMFIARFNYATQINAAALVEFDQRCAEVRAWVLDRVTHNIDNLKSLLVADGALVHTENNGKFGHSGADSTRHEGGLREFVVHHSMAKIKADLYSFRQGSGPVLIGSPPWKGQAMHCFFTGSASSWVIQIIPETAAQLAYLCGVSVDGLPDVLQHWSLVSKYHGNHILNRIDPMEWAVENPWCKLQFKVSVFVSRRGLTAIQKDAGGSIWEEPTEWYTNGGID